jgi:ATP-dependent Clp protease ATP-binding subunit ClpA
VHALPRWAGLVEARDEAARTGHRSVGTQHLLLALLATDGPVAAALHSAGIETTSVATTLAGIRGGSSWPTATDPVDLEVGLRAAEVLRLAAGHVAAEVMPRVEVSDEQVLRALLAVDDPAIARLVLSYHGARRKVVAALDEEATGSPTP